MAYLVVIAVNKSVTELLKLITISFKKNQKEYGKLLIDCNSQYIIDEQISLYVHTSLKSTA